jgi:GTP-binding protein
MPEVAEAEAPRIVLTPREPFEIIVAEDGAYEVIGERVERLAAMTDFDSDEGLGRFELVLGKMGVDKRLRELGAKDGDTVRIAGHEFDYS